MFNERALDQSTAKVARNQLSKIVILPMVDLSLTPISNCIRPELVVVSRAVHQAIELEKLRRYYSDLFVFFSSFNEPSRPLFGDLAIRVEEYDVFPSRFPYQSVVCL